MASRKRALLEPTDDWEQLQFQLDWPEQTRYELIRPAVVFGSPPVERAQQTGVSACTIYRQVGRFDRLGMQSLFEAEPVEDKRALPPAYRQAIVQPKAEYPAFRPNELATASYNSPRRINGGLTSRWRVARYSYLTGPPPSSMTGAFSEFEHALLRERQREGIALAKQRDVYRGRKKRRTPLIARIEGFT